MIRLWMAVFVAVCVGGAVFGQDRPYMPKVGGQERRAIMDTIREPVEMRLHRPVLFQIEDAAHDFRAQNGWAFIQARIRQKDGRPLGPAFYRQQAREGRIDSSDWVMALLHRDRAGQWRIVTYALCPTDVAWEGWDRAYHAPRTIFPYRP